MYYTTRSKVPWYPEEQAAWEPPEKYTRTKGLPDEKQESAIRGGRLRPTHEERSRPNWARNSEETVVPTPPLSSHDPQQPSLEDALSGLERERTAEHQDSQTTVPQESDPNLVTWYGPNDPANPTNWSTWKKNIVTAQLCLLTFSIYVCIPILVEACGVSTDLLSLRSVPPYTVLGTTPFTRHSACLMSRLRLV